ncbi:MAG: methionyl-tRNA formyltransferase [Alkalinema sp. RU_4_3]|nr:methionyl-tRNA formyltransferase [Alkalinema sp. RU_4_3]
MRVVFFGTPQFAVPSLVGLFCDGRFEVLGVVTQPDRRRGRGNELSPCPVKAAAVERGLTVWSPERVKKDAEVLATLRSLNADFFVVVAYGQLLSQEILDMPSFGCINGHGSLLPKYRGAAPIQWSLYNGEAETGMTTMLMDIGMDTGAMLLKSVLPLGLFDQAQDTAIALSNQAAALILETLPKLAVGEIGPIAQDNEAATYAPLIKKEDYKLDWSKSALAIHNQVRGFYPNCVATFRDSPLKVLATVPFDGVELPEPHEGLRSELPLLETTGQPGEVIALIKNHGAVVRTGKGSLLLREVQPAGKRSQSGWDFVNGVRVQVGDCLS